MIDLHLHTTYSDGSDTLAETLQKAQALGITALSITDHENCGAHNELASSDLASLFSGPILTGIELKSALGNTVVDILGYRYDLGHMNAELARYKQRYDRGVIQANVLEKFYVHGRAMGLRLDPIESLTWDEKHDWGSIVFYNEMKRHPENKERVPLDAWADFGTFKHRYYSIPGHLFYVNSSVFYPSVADVSAMIRRCGGKVFLAHLFEYRSLPDPMATLSALADTGVLDGVECYHSIFSPEQSALLRSFCAERGLLMSGGSDSHGRNKKDISIGTGKGDLCVPEEILCW